MSFEYPSGERTQLEYVLFRKTWRNSVKNARSYSLFSTVGSDHRIVSASVKLSLRVSKRCKPHPMKSIDWKAVSSNKALTQQFSLDVFNKFSALSPEEIDSDNIKSVYECLVKPTEEVAISTLPKKRRAGLVLNQVTLTELMSTSLKKVSEKYHKLPSQSNNIQ